MTCILSLMAFSAVAANSVELTVKGILTNGSSTSSLSNNGVIDFGDILLSELIKTEANQRGCKEITLTITCDSAMPVSWITVDNRADSMVPIQIIGAGANDDILNESEVDIRFGLGKTADGVNIGSYAIAGLVNDYTSDGSQAVGIYKNDSSWEPHDSGLQVRPWRGDSSEPRPELCLSIENNSSYTGHRCAEHH
ncbi:DUF1120 domain-containing protein [Enterobacter ludwigii]